MTAMTRSLLFTICLPAIAALAIGCAESAADKTGDAKPKKGIFGQKTQDIGQFDPKADQVVSDQKIHATDPITAPLAAYGPMVEKVSILAIDHAIQIFHATEGRYPKDHDEFMEKIVKANQIKLPVLPNGGQYKYDVENHGLLAVYPQKTDETKKGTE